MAHTCITVAVLFPYDEFPMTYYDGVNILGKGSITLEGLFIIPL